MGRIARNVDSHGAPEQSCAAIVPAMTSSCIGRVRSRARRSAHESRLSHGRAHNGRQRPIVRNPMGILNGFAGAIGNTPLIRLDTLCRETGCEILGKAEFLNPGGSVKDRAALYIMVDAERRGALKPGGIVVEGTAGNTGIGLAHLCAA